MIWFCSLHHNGQFGIPGYQNYFGLNTCAFEYSVYGTRQQIDFYIIVTVTQLCAMDHSPDQLRKITRTT